VLAALFLPIALSVKLTSRGPLFYRRARVGRDGKLFTMVKFRTMLVDSDSDISKLRTEPENDPRITAAGHFLRRFHLDEAPQFWNVIKNDMSVVGPRPEFEELLPELLKIEPRFNERTRVKPGVTGLAQVKYVHASEAQAAAERYRYDSQYMAEASLWKDILIILRTTVNFLRRPANKAKFSMLLFLSQELPRSVKLRFLLSIGFNLTSGLIPVASLGFLAIALIELNVGAGVAPQSQLFEIIAGALAVVGIDLNFASALSVGAALLGVNLILGYVRFMIIEIPVRRFQMVRTQEIAKIIYRANWLFLSDQRLARIFSVIRTEASQAISGVNVVVNFISAFIEGAVYVLGAFILSWPIAVTLIAAQLISVVVNRSFIGWARRLAERSLPIRIRYNARVLDAFGDVKAIKANHMEKTALNRLFPAMEDDFKVGVKDSYVSLHRISFNSIWRFALVYTSVIVAAFALGLNTELILLFVIIGPIIIARINALLDNYSHWARLQISFDVTHELMYNARQAAERMGGRSARLKQSVKFENVSFKYPLHKTYDESEREIAMEDEYRDAPEVLQNVSFEIPQGSIVAFVGQSGAGKTTVLDLITGLLQPTSGKISIDNVDYQDLDLFSIRDQIAYVAQSTTLFNDSIENNLKILNPYAEQADLEEACRKAQIHDFINQLPDRYETVIGERGIKLSGGQTQRIAVARALVKKFNILILDESTSNLDVNTEEQFMNMVYGLRGGITTLLSVHRVTAAMRSDIIFFFEGGKLIESGAPFDLVNGKGAFYSFWRKFYGDKQTEAKIKQAIGGD